MARAVSPKRTAPARVSRVGEVARPCRITPATPVGESYRDLGVKDVDLKDLDRRRTALSDGVAGAPLDLDLSLVDGLCRPIANVAVDVWHCDAVGVYSEGVQGRTFGRGRRVSDADGQVRFTTIWPGWYATRAVHLHVRVATPTPFATQLFLPDADNERRRLLPEYRVNNAPVVSNTDDPYWKQLGGSTLMNIGTLSGIQVMFVILGDSRSDSMFARVFWVGAIAAAVSLIGPLIMLPRSAERLVTSPAAA